jgi:hypothetical protein
MLYSNRISCHNNYEDKIKEEFLYEQFKKAVLEVLDWTR